MIPFKIGDVVRALRTNSYGVVEGELYTVLDLNGRNIRIDRDQSSYYTPERFELVTDTPPSEESDKPVHIKQERYVDNSGSDWIDEFYSTRSVEELRGAMIFTIGKYLRRVGKKDSVISEVKKIADYANRWLELELRVSKSRR